MKKVKLIIELDEDLYKEKIQGTTSNRQDRKILECVKNGTPLEEKFEEIKAEINELSYSRAGAYESEFSMCLDLIDNYIAELKGENK